LCAKITQPFEAFLYIYAVFTGTQYFIDELQLGIRIAFSFGNMRWLRMAAAELRPLK
jgi:hypothetical protein